MIFVALHTFQQLASQVYSWRHLCVLLLVITICLLLVAFSISCGASSGQWWLDPPEYV